MKLYQGAESTVEREGDVVIKTRHSKKYRVAELDDKFTKLGTRREAKILTELSAHGFLSPKLISVDENARTLTIEFIDGPMLKSVLTTENCEELGTQIGTQVSKLHALGIVHNDLTTSNMMLLDGKVYFIDFGLSVKSTKPEDRAVDLHLLKQAITSLHCSFADKLFEAVFEAYTHFSESEEVLERFDTVQKRGRNKH